MPHLLNLTLISGIRLLSLLYLPLVDGHTAPLRPNAVTNLEDEGGLGQLSPRTKLVTVTGGSDGHKLIGG